MKAMFAAFAAIAVIAFGAWFYLESRGDTTAAHNLSPSVRLD